MTEIYKNLYVGSLEDAFDDNILKNVQSILNVASELNIPERINHNYLHLGINDDDLTENICKIIPQCLNFIHENINKGILIHCLEGKSRSICIAIIYLKIYKKINIDYNIEYIKNKRDIDIFPLYLKQIKSYN